MQVEVNDVDISSTIISEMRGPIGWPGDGIFLASPLSTKGFFNFISKLERPPGFVFSKNGNSPLRLAYGAGCVCTGVCHR